MLQLLDRLYLDLPDPLTGDVKLKRDVLQGAWVVVVKAVAEFQDFAFGRRNTLD